MWKKPRRRFAVLLLCGLGLFFASPVSDALAQEQKQADSNAEVQAADSAAGQTSSDARAESQKTGMNFLRLIVLGGWFMIPLGLISLVVVALAIERGLALRRERQLPERLLARLGQLCAAHGWWS